MTNSQLKQLLSYVPAIKQGFELILSRAEELEAANDALANFQSMEVPKAIDTLVTAQKCITDLKAAVGAVPDFEPVLTLLREANRILQQFGKD